MHAVMDDDIDHDVGPLDLAGYNHSWLADMWAASNSFGLPPMPQNSFGLIWIAPLVLLRVESDYEFCMFPLSPSSSGLLSPSSSGLLVTLHFSTVSGLICHRVVLVCCHQVVE